MSGYYFELDGHQFGQYVEAMAHADIWGFPYAAIQWVLSLIHI